jgi:hypothetical protein
MKRTEIEARMRELKRQQKMEEYYEKCEESDGKSVSDYIDELYGMLYYNEEEIMNIPENLEILELFEELKEEHPEKKHWNNVIKKAVRKTGVEKSRRAKKQLHKLLAM